MLLARSMFDKTVFPFAFILLCLSFFTSAEAQDNSPYSRYGLGNQFPSTNIISRSMGGVSAAYNDFYNVNYVNPASYARFQAILEQRSGKMQLGRVVFDLGVSGSSRTLTPPNTPTSFTSTDILFSHVYVGVPLKKNWGLSFGMRPLNRINYNVFKRELLTDPSTGLGIDSAITQFQGSGGSFLPTIGTGFGTDNFSIGVNVGYLFGKRESITRRIFLNDSVDYFSSNHTTNSSYGDIFLNAGAQYHVDISRESRLRFGLAGNWKQSLSATQDLRRYTYNRNAAGGESVIDSIYDQTGAAGEIIYPTSYTAGMIYENAPGERVRGWTLGVDYAANNWDQYRFFGQRDSVQNGWEIRVGGQLIPISKPSRYGHAITYRFGFHIGEDYIRVHRPLPVFGVSFGMGLPIVNYSRLSQNQFSVVNLAFEYGRRGNDENVLKENIYRLSIGLNLTDLWFGKRRYE